MRKKVGFIAIETVEPPWDDAIDELQQPPFSLVRVNGKRVITPYIALCLLDEAVWGCALHWLYKKKWHKSYKHPFPLKVRRDLEPLGELLRSTLELCGECHLYPSPYSKPYNHASEWFTGAASELRWLSFRTLGGKDKCIKRLRAYLSRLKNEKPENPFSPDTTPHLWRLTEVSLALAKSPQYPNFEQKFLRRSDKKTGEKGFILALSAWTTKIQVCSSFTQTRANAYEINQRAGRGHEWVKIPFPSVQKMLS